MTTNRRLAAIMVADVVGYSRLMEADEIGTLAALKERRKAVLDPVTKAHGGRIVKVMGDGVLVEFASAVNAVQGAIELQKKMAEANRDIPDAQQIVLRIGINLGDVIGEGSDIYGDGINIAARLEAMAGPGGIAVSRNIHEQIVKKIDIEIDDLGEKQFKNIAQAVRVYQVRVGNGQRATNKPSPTLPDRPSIAVLPFQNMSGDPEQEYFADGITEDIITELSRFRSLSVIARNSSFTYKGKPVKIAKVARDLGVGFVVEGSVRRMGNRVRITAQLINASSGDHVWAERYDRPVDDLFSVQDEVVRYIVATTEGRLANSIGDKSASKLTPNIAAYELVLKARQSLGTFDLVTAEPLLYDALVLDPSYAQAYAYVAMVNYVRYFDDHDPETIDRAIVMGKKAVALDDSDSICHAQLGAAYTFKGQFELAEFHSGRAVLRNPADVVALAFRAHWLSRSGRAEEALQLLDEVVRVDPFPPATIGKTALSH